MKTFYSNHSSKNILALNIDILSLCNFKCPYCYNIKKYSNLKRLMTISEIKCIINDINANQNDVLFDIHILGGEPFLHPKLSTIIEMFSKCQNVRYIDIFTNGSIIKSLKRFVKTRLWISIHPECDFQKVDKLLKLNNVAELTFMIHKDFNCEKYYEYSKKYSVAHTFIISLNGKLHFKDLKLPNKGKYYINNIAYSIDEVFLNHFNKFKDWKCLFSNINVDVNGNYGINCLQRKNKNIFADHFLRTYKPNFMSCTLNECNSDCNLECYKYFEER
jgi:organic radical activating enzyme